MDIRYGKICRSSPTSHTRKTPLEQSKRSKVRRKTDLPQTPTTRCDGGRRWVKEWMSGFMWVLGLVVVARSKKMGPKGGLILSHTVPQGSTTARGPRRSGWKSPGRLYPLRLVVRLGHSHSSSAVVISYRRSSVSLSLEAPAGTRQELVQEGIRSRKMEEEER